MFCLHADEILKIAEVSRISRDGVGRLIGYQRPLVRKHVQSIVDYLDSGKVLFPNSIILAVSSACSFKEIRGPKVDEGIANAGTISIPIPRHGQPKPAWIVDGQQRAMALSRAKRSNIPVPVNAFVADDLDTQREQFLRVNSSKPLPRGLITELLPQVASILPPNLALRRTPAALCDMLNLDPESPFFGLIRRTSSRDKARSEPVADGPIIQMLQDSLTLPSGCLFAYRNIATGETDFPAVRRLLFIYWGAVRETFPDAWGLSPKQSRLMHGAGIRAMGKLMDRVMGTADLRDDGTARRITRELASLKNQCRWTGGQWDELGGLRWNELQNLPGHIRSLTSFIVRAYLSGR
jgi:DGQHR domain-containing protein